MVLELKVPHDAMFSLFPFATVWMGEDHFAAGPVAACGVVLLMAAIAYWLLLQRLIAADGAEKAIDNSLVIVPLMGSIANHSHRSRPCAIV